MANVCGRGLCDRVNINIQTRTKYSFLFNVRRSPCGLQMVSWIEWNGDDIDVNSLWIFRFLISISLISESILMFRF